MILSRGDTLVLASNNQGKLAVMNDLLLPYGLHVVPVGNYTQEEPVEDGDTYAANAIIKARAAATASGLPALAEDSGIEFPVMDGKPGVLTARWVKQQGGWEKAMEYAHGLVQQAGNDRLDFCSAVALAWPDGTVMVEFSTLTGRFVYPARGVDGFGFDSYYQPAPVEGFNFFVPPGDTRTYAEMTPPEKAQTSPRATALIKLLQNMAL